MIYKEAALNGQAAAEFMRSAILEKLEDGHDYQDAINNSKESYDCSLSGADVLQKLDS